MSNSLLKISEAATIGLHAMIMLAKNHEKMLTLNIIAKALNVSPNHLSKVMQRLNKAGFIESIKGYNGGFKMALNPEEVSFLEIYETFDGKLKCGNCLLTNNCEKDCIFGDLVSSVNKQVKDKFEQTKLSDFIK